MTSQQKQLAINKNEKPIINLSLVTAKNDQRASHYEKTKVIIIITKL